MSPTSRDRWRVRALLARSDRPVVVVLAVRAGILALVIALTLVLEGGGSLGTELLLLTAVAALASLPVPGGWALRWRPLAEGAAAAAVLSLPGSLPYPLLPYLLVAPFAAGVLAGFAMAVATTVMSGVVLLLGILYSGAATTPLDSTTLVQWIGLALAVGLIGAWARVTTISADPGIESYRAANRLLTELREVTRSLPTGLDEVALAENALQRLRDEVGFDRAALFMTTESGVLVPMAYLGADRLDWLPDQAEPSPWSRAWRSGRPEQATGTFAASGVVPYPERRLLVVPMLLGERKVGLVGAERDEGGWGRSEVHTASRLLSDAAGALDTGALFSEVRVLATMEERRRLAREIHDGVAQEVAALGFAVDDLRARVDDPEITAALVDLRGELSRVVQELRLSIFDLRSDVQPTAGLGASLTSYVRQVGTGSGMTVHLVLDESSHRLPIEMEAEMLRIAQEAITNARRHARARNLWVTCRVSPPRAFLRVADDGRGLGRGRPDSFGMEIMRERAVRIGAVMTCRSRVGGGTVIEVALGRGLDAVAPVKPRGDDKP